MQRTTIPITQSLMKAISEYLNGNECGLRLEFQFVDGNFFPPTEAMHIGIYFEYKAFGTLPKDGKVPVPKIKKGKNQKFISVEQSELVKKYQTAVDNAKKFRDALDFYGLKLVSAGQKLTYPFPNGVVAEGTTDLVLLTTKDLPIYNSETDQLVKVIPPNTQIIGDAKTSGLMGERGKWAEMGWNIDFLDQKPKIMMQAQHYTFLGEKIFGEKLPFIFFVFSQQNDKDATFIHVDVSDERLYQHEEIIIATDTIVKREILNGWKAHPSYERCSGCQIATHCQYKIIYPTIYNVNY